MTTNDLPNISGQSDQILRLKIQIAVHVAVSQFDVVELSVMGSKQRS